MTRPRVLVVTLGSVGESMAGIAIRAVELARSLSAVAEVTIATVEITGNPDLDIPVEIWHRHDARTLRPLLADVDFVVSQPQWPLVARELRRGTHRLIYDVSVPEPLEILEIHRMRPMWRRKVMSAFTSDRLVRALHDGDHFLVSTEKQLDLWLGVLLAERLLGPEAHDGEMELVSRFTRLPHGLPDEPPRRTDAPGVREAFPQLTDEDEIVLWNSAIWSWFDADTAIRGVAELAGRRPSVKLVFMARDRSQPELIQPFESARALASELGLLDRHIFFNDRGVPYTERANWLLDADVALACHRPHLETRFSFRTRYLDCLWASLPAVVTEGDELAQRITRDDLGAAVPAEDPQAVADALAKVLDHGKHSYEARIAQAAEEYRWSRVARPLMELVATEGVTTRVASPRRPGHMARDWGYSAARSVLNPLGIRDWPRQ